MFALMAPMREIRGYARVAALSRKPLYGFLMRPFFLVGPADVGALSFSRLWAKIAQHMITKAATPDEYYTASRFLEHAFAFAAAADAYSARSPIMNTMPLNFLMGRAIELALKAYLLSKSISMTVLRSKFGHDLEAGLVLALEKGFNTEELATPTDQKVITGLNSHYSGKDFEYPQKSQVSGFNEGIVRATTNRVLRTAAIEVWGREIYNQRAQEPEAARNGLLIASDAKYEG